MKKGFIVIVTLLFILIGCGSDDDSGNSINDNIPPTFNQEELILLKNHLLLVDERFKGYPVSISSKNEVKYIINIVFTDNFIGPNNTVYKKSDRYRFEIIKFDNSFEYKEYFNNEIIDTWKNKELDLLLDANIINRVDLDIIDKYIKNLEDEYEKVVFYPDELTKNNFKFDILINDEKFTFSIRKNRYNDYNLMYDKGYMMTHRYDFDNPSDLFKYVSFDMVYVKIMKINESFIKLKEDVKEAKYVYDNREFRYNLKRGSIYYIDNSKNPEEKYMIDLTNVSDDTIDIYFD